MGGLTKILKHRKNLARTVRTIQGVHACLEQFASVTFLYTGIYATMMVSAAENLPMGILQVCLVQVAMDWPLAGPEKA